MLLAPYNLKLSTRLGRGFAEHWDEIIDQGLLILQDALGNVLQVANLLLLQLDVRVKATWRKNRGRQANGGGVWVSRGEWAWRGGTEGHCSVP